MRSIRFTLFAQYVMGIILTMTLPGVGMAQRSSRDKFTPEELRAFFDRVVEGYTIQNEKGVEAKRSEQALLHWANPVRQSNQGSLFVWTIAGRPIALGSIFSFDTSLGIMYRHEMVSMAAQPLKANLNGRLVWQPTASNGEWKEVETRPPAKIASLRLVQLRAIARHFSGEKVEVEGEVVRLKLMPQPLYRYQAEEAGVIDGAIFGIVEATDPDIYLMIEAYKTKEGAAKWRYAAFPSHFVALKLFRGKEVVWSSPLDLPQRDTEEGQLPWAAKPYFSFFSRDGWPKPETLRNPKDD